MGSYLIVLDEQAGNQAQANAASPTPSVKAIDISSRAVDPEPLTTDEVFPSDVIVIDPERPNEAYQVLFREELTDCRKASTGKILTLIEGMNCTQVVRGTMRSTASSYLVTGGIMNLDSVESAEDAWTEIRGLVNEQEGRFLGFAPDAKTRPLALASTQVGWNIKGHYLAYCVIAREDGQAIPVDDPYATQILYDVVEFYLKGQILEARATDPIDGAETQAPDPAPSG